MNVPPIIAALVSRKVATLHELSTVYGVEDAYDLMEIVSVNAHNEAQLNKVN